MESKIIFHRNIDDDPEDFTRMQDFAEAALDHVVADGISANTKYTGFGVTKSATTVISVAPGRLYSGGKVYGSGATAWTKDFITLLPTAGKKIAAVVTWGTEADTDVRPRQFLINAETRQAEPQAVALVHSRIANLNVSVGAEAPDPTPPLVDAGYTVIAYVTLTPAGVDTIAMQGANELPSVQDHEDRIQDLEEFEISAGFQMKTLASDIAGIKSSTESRASRDDVGRTLQRLAILEAKAGVSSAAVDSDANFFLDAAKTKLDDPLSHVKIEEGVRFPAAAEAVTALGIFNALDPFAKVKNGVLFPNYDREAWLQSGERSGETQIASFSQTTFSMVQKTMSRQRVRYGESFTVCTNSLWWQTGQYDIYNRTFTKNGETFEVVATELSLFLGIKILRIRKVWTDTVENPYWDKVSTTLSVPGAQIAETWLQGQNMWTDQFGLLFTRLATTGNAHAAIVEVNDYGLPNLNSVIAATTILRENMVLNAETVVPIQPTFLQAGKRYALVVTTPADHWVATVPGASFTQGTFFYVLDGAYAQGDATKDLWFKLYRMKFNQARTVINLNALQLSGGILAIDVLAGAIIPEGTSLSYEIQVGSVWYNLNDVDSYILGQGGTIPPLLPFRAVFNGSVDIMPAINLNDSQVKVSRPDITARSISQTRTLPAGSTQIRVIERYEYFDPAYHTASCQLRTGGSFATVVTPSSTSTFIDPVDGAYERTYVFNLGSAVTTFRKDTQIDTTSAQKTFHVAWQKDYAL